MTTTTGGEWTSGREARDLYASGASGKNAKVSAVLPEKHDSETMNRSTALRRSPPWTPTLSPHPPPRDRPSIVATPCVPMTGLLGPVSQWGETLTNKSL